MFSDDADAAHVTYEVGYERFATFPALELAALA